MEKGGATITAVVCDPQGNARVLAADELDRIDEIRKGEGRLVWLDVANPGPEQIDLLRREFAIHPLAEEDLNLRHQRPKLDSYPGQHVLVGYEVLPEAGKPHRRPSSREVAGSGGGAQLGEIHAFTGKGYVVTVHWGQSPVIEDVLHRFKQRADAVGRTAGGLLYALLDTMVDGYFPVLDRLSERIDELEDRIIRGRQGVETLREVLDLKRQLLKLRRVLAPERDVANSLLRRDVELIDDQALPYYQDLYDHLVRVLDQLDLYRDLVAAALEANLSVTSNNLNAVMKRLTAFTVVLMVPTLIAGIYGMNFHGMPELSWPFGYPLALVVMAALMGVIALYFKRNDWF
jgi:magnesium transporter